MISSVKDSVLCRRSAIQRSLVMLMAMDLTAKLGGARGPVFSDLFSDLPVRAETETSPAPREGFARTVAP